MKEQIKAFILVKFAGCLILFLSILSIWIFSEPRRLSYLSLRLFEHQEMIKNISITLLFVGVFFLFYSSSKVPDKTLKLKLGKGEVRMHLEIIKESVERWMHEEKLSDVKLMAVYIRKPDQIALELKTHNLDQALVSLETVEEKLQGFLKKSFGLKGSLEVQLFEV